MRKSILISYMVLFLGVTVVAQSPQVILPADQQTELVAFLKAHWMPPEDYVVSKFKDHDIVFIGEFHRIKQDPTLIQALIPLLYKAGVLNLGIEFANYSDQPLIDKLINAEKYDEGLARRIAFQALTFWGYKEYEDIYRAAWELNRSLPKDAPRFRVVGLEYSPNYKLMTVPKEQLTNEQCKKIWYNGNGDEYMAGVILKEFVAKGRKALIYSGSHHAFTRYHLPYYDYETKTLNRLADNRMGNLVYAKIGSRAFFVFLHSPWMTKESEESMALPVGGAVDTVMANFADKRVGFDVAGTPFGKLKDPNAYYALGHDGFCLEDFCDGYIYQRPFKDYQGVTTDPRFVTAKNFHAALDGLANPQAKSHFKTPEDCTASMRRDADIPARFKEWGIVPSK